MGTLIAFFLDLHTGVVIRPLKEVLKSLRQTKAILALRTLCSPQKPFYAAQLQPIIDFITVSPSYGKERTQNATHVLMDLFPATLCLSLIYASNNRRRKA